MPRNPRKLKPSWAQLFARRTRIRLSSLSPEKVTVLGAIINIILAAVKLGVGSLVGSAVLLADGWHSLGDLVSDVLCMVAVKIGARPPTPRHPNGFRKIEHVLSLGIAAILASGGVAMTWSSLGALRSTPLALTGRASLAATDLAALSVAVVSVLSKELLFGVTHAIGLRNRSPSIIANAYHHRSDALSSLIAIVGIAGALCGCAWLDPFAATAVGLMVTWMGREVSRESIAELMAPPVTTLPEEQSAPTEPEDPELAADAPPLRANSPLSGSVHPVAAAQSVGAGGSGGDAGRQAGRAQPTSASRRTAPSPRMGMPRMLVRTSVSRPSPRTGTPRMLVSKLPMAIAGGAAAGGLHAISGPDHLAALLPLCLGRRWYLAATTGAIWGLGHGVGAALVGLLGFALRGTLNLDALSGYMEAAVGISIIIIGATGLIEARQWQRDVQSCTVQCDVLESPRGEILMSEEVPDAYASCDEPPPQDVARTLLNGVLNGVSGTGHVLGVLPALAMPNWAVAGTYLGCFGMGTFLTMALFTGLVGELSSQLGNTLNRPAAPATIAMAASACALAVGSFWTCRALAILGVPAAILRLAAA